MLNQLYLLGALVRMVGKCAGSCCVLGGPECWGPLQRVKDALKWVPLAGQSSSVDSLTLWPVAGLSVAALHCGGHQVAPMAPHALMHGVQVPLSVRADHLSISRARSTAPGTLPGKNTTLILRRSATTVSKHPRVLTRPQSPTCHVTCVGQDAISQRWTVCGRRRWAQDNSSIFMPLESAQVTSLVCSPDPHVTEHYRHKLLHQLHISLLQMCSINSFHNSPRSNQPHDTLDTRACCTSAKRVGPQHRRHKRRPQRHEGQRNRGTRTPLCAPESPRRR